MGKPGLIISVLIIIIVVLAGCNKPMPKEEAVKYLRAADNEVIQLARQIYETKAYNSLHTLVDYNNSPLPSVFSNRVNKNSPDQQYIISNHLGIYQYDQFLGEFVKVSTSDSVIVRFPFQSPNDSLATFVLANYKEEASLLSTAIPTLIDAKMFINKISVLSIDYQGEMSHGIPVRGELNAILAKFIINFSQKIRLSQDHGKMKADLTISTRSKELLESTLDAKLVLSDAGELSFNKVTTKCRIFPVEILAKAGYGKIDPFSRDFIEEYNQNTSIQIFSWENHQKIGDVYLSNREKSDKLNITVQYEDHSIEFMEDLMLTVDAFLNVKKE